MTQLNKRQPALRATQ